MNVSQNSESSLESMKNIIPCFVCGKQSIYNMKCRCSLSLCKRHFCTEKHNCKFDFTAHANVQISDKLQKIESEKITTI